jgi:hypothetical protein
MKFSLFTLAVFFYSFCKSQTIPINPFVYGQNANLTATIGINTSTGGKMDKYWQTTTPLDTQNYVKQSRVYNMRYSGINVEIYCLLDGVFNNPLSNIRLTINDYIRKALIMQDNGIVPVLALPLSENDDDDTASFSIAAGRIAKLVKNVNDSLTLKYFRPAVTHWVYPNEPEEGGYIGTTVIHGYDSTDAAKFIYRYIRSFHDSVMAIWKPSWNGTFAGPQFIGPELYSFDNYTHTTTGLTRLIEQLCGKYNPTGTNYSILPYLSEFSWHFYAFNDESQPTIGIPIPTDSNLVDILASGVPRYGIAGNSKPLQQNIDSLKSWLGTSGVKMAITEANVCHKNDVNQNDTYNITNDAIKGNGANSFRGAQVYAELMSICMKNNIRLNMWSGIEGCGTGCNDSLYKTNVGYLNSDPSKFGGLGGKKPLWHTFKLLSDNFHGNFYQGNYFHNGAGGAAKPVNHAKGVKSFASVEPAGIKVLIMNQNDSAYKFRLNFNSSMSVGSDTLLIQFPNLASDGFITLNNPKKNYPTPADITYFPIPGRSTILLTFDCNGVFQSRKDYTETNAIAGTGPHYRQFGNTVVDASAMAKNTISCGHAGIGGTISSNTTFTNDTVYVNSNILLAGNTTLTFINCLVVMAPGTKIKATPLSSIVLKKTVMIGCEGTKTWQGLELIGNYKNGNRLLIENSTILNAKYPVKADKIPDIKITKSVFANGEGTAIELSRSQSFSFTENLVLGFNTGIKTTDTKPNYVSEIKNNRMIDVETALKFVNDGHNMLENTCNLMLYKSRGIETLNTDLAEMGSPAMSSGNTFLKMTPGVPLDYINHNGSPTKLYYGASQIVQFSLPLIANIPILQASADRVCLTAAPSVVCSGWTVGITEHNETINPNILIYPNPSTGAFTINYSNLPKGNWTLNIFDVLGKLINTRKVDANAETTTFQINSNGLYFVSLQSGDNRITQKVIVE